MGANSRPTSSGLSIEEHAGNIESNPSENQETVRPGTIARAKQGERAKRVEKPDQGRSALLPEESITSSQVSPKALNYRDLEEYHLSRIRFDEAGNQRPRTVLRNHRSVISSWIKFHLAKAGRGQSKGAGEPLILGNEIGINFAAALLDYLSAQEGEGKKRSTVNDRKSIMWSIKESATELIRLDGLPEGFAEALAYLVNNSDIAAPAIAKAAGIEKSGVYRWKSGRGTPGISSLPAIERLEDLFKLNRGTLSQRLPLFQVTRGERRPKTCTTPWRAHLRLLQQFPYNLNELPLRVEDEFRNLVLFNTDDVWVAERGLERAGGWRIRLNRGTIPTADAFHRDVKCFLSFLHLPSEAENVWLRGKDLPLEAMSLVLCGDADLVLAYAEFRRCRAYSQCFNTNVVTFVSHCKSLLRKETGFLRQQPHFGDLLPIKVPAAEWENWCETNHKKMDKFLRVLRKSKNRPLKMSRDPFAAVRNIIEERQHPISALMEMTAGMRRLIPLKAKYAPELLPLFMRDIAFVELITSFPMRAENFSMLTWIPADPADLVVCDKEYVKTTEDSNLYQKPDGAWWIRIPSEGVKNGKAVHIPVVASVVPTLKEYLFRHRPRLNLAIKRALIKRREAESLPPLTPEEERAIDLCPYVFRPSSIQVHQISSGRLSRYTGVEQVSVSSLTYLMFKLTQKYIPNCKGFRAHAVRHIVASEYIKNYPNGCAVAAAALNISEAVVRRHYAWVRPCDQIKPWQEYHESLRRKIDDAVSLV